MAPMHPAERATEDPSTGGGSPFGSLSLEHSSTVERVADELRRAVFEGEIESGTALREVARAVAEGASYQELNQRHLTIHLSLVGLTDSPRLVSMAESIVAELRLALAQIDRVRRNARDQAGSHHHLLDLLQAGDVDAAVAELGVHMLGAVDTIIECVQ